MHRGSDPDAEEIETTSFKQCWAMPLVVYEDGPWIGRRLQSLAEIQKTGTHYATHGTSTIVSQKGTSIEVRAENGMPGSGSNVVTRGYDVRPGNRGTVLPISADGKDDRVLASCTMPRFEGMPPLSPTAVTRRRGRLLRRPRSRPRSARSRAAHRSTAGGPRPERLEIPLTSRSSPRRPRCSRP